VDLEHLLTRDEDGQVDWAEALSLGEHGAAGVVLPGLLLWHGPQLPL
jgi:hypothetical protein